MKRDNQEINAITEVVIWKQLLLFFFPIVLGTFFRQLYNMRRRIALADQGCC